MASGALSTKSSTAMSSRHRYRTRAGYPIDGQVSRSAGPPWSNQPLEPAARYLSPPSGPRVIGRTSGRDRAPAEFQFYALSRSTNFLTLRIADPPLPLPLRPFRIANPGLGRTCCRRFRVICLTDFHGLKVRLNCAGQ